MGVLSGDLRSRSVGFFSSPRTEADATNPEVPIQSGRLEPFGVELGSLNSLSHRVAVLSVWILRA